MSINAKVFVEDFDIKPTRRFKDSSVIGLHVNAPEDVASLVERANPDVDFQGDDWQIIFGPRSPIMGVDEERSRVRFDTSRLVRSVHILSRYEGVSPAQSFQRHIGKLVVAQALGVPEYLPYASKNVSMIKKTLLGLAFATATLTTGSVFGPEVADGVSAETMQKVEAIMPFFLLGSTALFGVFAYGLDKHPPVDESRYEDFVKENSNLIQSLNTSILPIFPKTA